VLRFSSVDIRFVAPVMFDVSEKNDNYPIKNIDMDKDILFWEEVGKPRHRTRLTAAQPMM
jgi:hypothetical protein